MAEEREVIGWFTVNGVHRPIYEGESKQDAYNREVAKLNEDTKNRQIAKSKEQADRLNGKIQRDNLKNATNLPKTLALKNIKAEEANKTSDVLKLGQGKNGKRFDFKNGTEIRDAYVFAGKGCRKEFRDAQKYADKYAKKGLNIGKAEDWQHCAGKAVITDGVKDYVREVHWVQGNDGKIREAFIKEYPKNLEKRK